MFDYYTHVNSMSEDKLHQEVEKLYNRIFKTPPDSSIYEQLRDCLDMAEEALNDKQALRQFQGEKSEAIDIGEMESVVHHPVYDPEELLLATITAYTKNLSDKSEKKD